MNCINPNLPGLQPLSALSRSSRPYFTSARTPRPDLTEDQAAAVTTISAAAGNMRWAADRLVYLGVPLPPKKARSVGALLARADEVEQLLMQHLDAGGADTSNAVGDAYINLCGLLTYLKPAQIGEVMGLALTLAQANQDAR